MSSLGFKDMCIVVRNKIDVNVYQNTNELDYVMLVENLWIQLCNVEEDVSPRFAFSNMNEYSFSHPSLVKN